jgi:hypothetical protein
MRFPVVVSVIALSAFSFGAGCSSSTTQDPGVANDTQIEQREVNPEGVPYPTKGIGYDARAGTRRGSVIKNYKFLGYPGANKADGLKTVALVDYFDPKHERVKLIHLTVAGVWCGPCIQETQDVVRIKSSLESKGIVFLQALGDGPAQGTGASKSDLDTWIDKYKVNFDIVLDPDVKNLGPFFDRGAIPWNADIDPRSMEILYAQTGYIENIPAHAQKYLDWMAKNEPTTYE